MNSADAPAPLEVSPRIPPRKEHSCLPVRPSRLCHAKGDTHMRCTNLHLTRQILELPPFHTLGLQDGVKHPTVSGLEIWRLVSSWLSVPLFPHQINPRCLLPKAAVRHLCLRRALQSLGNREKHRSTARSFVPGGRMVFLRPPHEKQTQQQLSSPQDESNNLESHFHLGSS